MNDVTPPRSALPPIYHLYLDDSGSRFLDRLPIDADKDPRWFSLAGVLVKEEDEAACKEARAGLAARWPKLTQPLHLTDMHSRRKGFAWLEALSPADRGAFWRDYHHVMSELPVIGHGCVVHRPGYRDRDYGSREGDAKWNLCRTAFNILVERAAKIAHSEGRRLRVKYEGSDPKADQALRGYWALLKAGNGLGFNEQNAAKYDPFPPAVLAATLIDLERKDKRSVLMQFADTFALAISRGRYQPDFSTYAAIRNARRLADDYVGAERAKMEGIKYSCFDGV
jgi:hypothetical protein